MKTRGKATKVTKGRKSNVICVKSSINHKNTGYTLRSQTKNSCTIHCKSPSNSVRHNGSISKISSNPNKDAQVIDKIEEKQIDTSKLNTKGETLAKKDHADKVDMDSVSADNSTESRKKLKRKAKIDALTALTTLKNCKKRKTLKKCPLFRSNESDNKSLESVIMVYNLESTLNTKAILAEPRTNATEIVNSSSQEVDQSVVKSELLENTLYSNKAFIEYDSDMEMEAYHEAFKPQMERYCLSPYSDSEFSLLDSMYKESLDAEMKAYHETFNQDEN